MVRNVGDQEHGRTMSPTCCICPVKDPAVLSTTCHMFCYICIDEAFKNGTACSTCSTRYFKLIGDQPEGTMTFTKESLSLPGHEDVGTIVINYTFSSGIQGSNHPNPGKRYYGTNQTAYLPDNEEGNKVLGLLKKAFDRKLIFTIISSEMEGHPDHIVWDKIHHKTNPSAGPKL